MRVKILSILLLSLLALTGCAAHNPNLKSYFSPDMPQFSVADAAADVVDVLASAYPPGQTTLALASGDSLFDQDLEDKLRARGFKIITEKDPADNTLELLYKVDRLFSESSCYLTVTLSDGFIYSRLYKLDGDKCLPVSTLHGRK